MYNADTNNELQEMDEWKQLLREKILLPGEEGGNCGVKYVVDIDPGSMASAHFAVWRGAPLVQLPLRSELVGAPEKKRVPTVTAAVIRQVTLAPEKNKVF